MNFTPQKREFYTKEGFGLGYSVITTAEWNLAALTSKMFYAYENNRGIDVLAAEFDPDMLEAVRATLKQEIGGQLVEVYMKEESPFNFLEALQNNPAQMKKLEIAVFWKNEFLNLVTARCATWLTTNRRAGNRILPRITVEQVALIEKVSNGY